jgi:trigger factor
MADEEDTPAGGDELEVAEAEPKTPEEEALEKLKEHVDVQIEDVGVLRKKLTINVARAALDEEFNTEYGELLRDAEVPGFRKGRAPRALVEKRFGSDVGETVKTRLLSRAYVAATEKESLNVLGDPLFWVTLKQTERREGEKVETEQEKLVNFEQAADAVKLPAEGDFVFTCEVEVKPEFELPKLVGIPVEKPTLAVSDEDVTAMIDRQRMMRGTYEPVSEGGVQPNDLVVADMRMTCEGHEIKQQENVAFGVRGQPIEGVPLPDLGEVLEGATPGETRTVSSTVPEDHESLSLRGKEAVFEFKINDIKRLVVPALDKGFLGSLGYDSEGELREDIRNRLVAGLAEQQKKSMRDSLATWLLENVALDLPSGLSQRQTARVAARQMIELSRQGVPEAEIEKHVDELRTGAEQKATNDLKLFFMLEKIAEELDVGVTEEEVNAAIGSIAAAQNRRFDRVRDDLFRGGQIESLYVQIREEKCLDRLLADAEIKEVDLSKAAAEQKKPKTAKPAAKKVATTKKAAAPAKKTAKKAVKKTTKKKSAKKS